MNSTAVSNDTEAMRPRFGDRSLFPSLGFSAYYAHAAISPVSIPVAAVVERFLRDVAQRGAASFLDWSHDRAQLREDFGRLIGAPAENVALTAGTSHGLTQLALSLPLEDQGHIVSFEGEFPANIIPFAQAVTGTNSRLILLPAPDPRDPDTASQILDATERELHSGARYISVSAVQFQTGYQMPLKEMGALCRKHDAFLLVDAIQAVGVVPMDVRELEIDALAVGAHKWLLGLEGAGMLFVSDRLRQILRPRTMGWTSFVQAEDFLFEGANCLRYDREPLPSARVFEGSTMNAVGLAALRAGLGMCQELTPRAIYEHVQGIHDALEDVMIPFGFNSLRAQKTESRSCIVSFQLPSHVPLKQLAAGLRARGVMPSTPDGLLRFAPHFANSKAEVSIVRDALSELLGR